MSLVSGPVRVGTVLIAGLLTACVTAPAVDRNSCAVASAKSWTRTELYFGTAQPDGSLITDEQYQQFLDAEVTPRFGDGFTLLTARGQFLGANGVIVREPSKVLVLFYPFDERKSAVIEEIRTAFQRGFHQESVMRVDGAACVAF